MSTSPTAHPAQPDQDRTRRSSATVPVVASAVLLLVGLPLFLRLPVWCDITLYDMAARNVLAGGTHYRDVFDTNTPGYVWLLAAVRSLAGWSAEALRVVDLLFFAGNVLVLDRMAARGGATRTNRHWMIAGCIGCYLFTEESVHAQRDVWLALPALLAVSERLKRIAAPAAGVFRGSALEGLLWGVAVWVKPHFLVVAAVLWVLTVRRLAGGQPRPWRATAADLLGNLTGGGAMGAAGVGYLMATGTWPHFLDVMTVWNVGYMEGTIHDLHRRTGSWLVWIPPWSFVLPPTVVLAVIGLIDARVWSARVREPARGGLLQPIAFRGVWHTGGTDHERFTRGVLGAVYLAWVCQSLFLQRAFMYAHAVEVLLSLAVWAAYRWNLPALFLAWFAGLAVAWAVWPTTLADWSDRDRSAKFVLTTHPATDRNRLKQWPACFRTDLAPADYWRLKDALRHEQFHAASIGWAELHEVAEYLRGRQVGDRELVCWHDSTHPLYLMLGVAPGLRFMHVNTASMISWQSRGRVADEYRANPAVRFGVIDLRWYALLASQADDDVRLYDEPGHEFDLLPPRMPDDERRSYPFAAARTVFRSNNGCGRYVVFQIR